ncbi:hypothetical protein MUK42_27237 [Musa troglodytarum]|uniref:Uncharacterized protein n=1 Tax=Musa troglodytarum TaxID=320322 RepID=A0A9E7FRD7_9LILI|nr:hypothetical protein MUK42_27237 [Musa troglodytarum]
MTLCATPGEEIAIGITIAIGEVTAFGLTTTVLAEQDIRGCYNLKSVHPVPTLNVSACWSFMDSGSQFHGLKQIVLSDTKGTKYRKRR